VCLDGKGGGLALYWSEEIKVNLINYSSHHIDIRIIESDAKTWRCTFVYGEPKSQDRHEMWKLLKRIKREVKEPWLMAGDFNEAMWQHEHFSATKRNERQMESFRKVLSTCNLHDLGFSGPCWTYNNKQKGIRNVKVRLDRAVACPLWSNMFPHAEVKHLISSRSDHLPILINLQKNDEFPRGNGCFRYEMMWERVESLEEEINVAWNGHVRANCLQNVHQKLKSTMVCLKSWSRENFGAVSKEINKIKNRLQWLYSQQPLGYPVEIDNLNRRLDELLLREEIMWKQRSRTNWLKHGDQNTRYFHRKATWRAKKNKIRILKTEEGQTVVKQNELETLANDYFTKMYTKDMLVAPELIEELIEQKVNQQMNDDLTRDFTDREIGDALFQIGPLKAPGVDGFPARFFQRNWGILKDEIIAAVKKFFQEGVMPSEINETVIVLIPKNNDPETLKDFRPISLCNVVYKIVAKCIVNRLRPMLDELINEAQSAFIPGRLITDNALIAFECFHSFQRNKKERGSFCAYKLDLTKAYERVDWRYLETILTKFGFHTTFVRWIMSCITSVQYKVKVNGVLTSGFKPTRGIRQGDPLSPFLFLFVSEGLSKVLQHAVYLEELKDLRICRRAPGISHLLFADDCLLFFEADATQAGVIKAAIGIFEVGSGQLVNQSKCSVLFNEACPEEIQQSVKQILEVEHSSFEEKYLGLPTPDGRMKAERFQPLKERYRKRLTDYAEKYMSMAAKETLIKAVAQALSIYVMGVFQLSASFHDDYMKMIRKFWWGEEENKRKVHWESWDTLTDPKCMGGMGFRDSRCFNQALLARQAWRLLNKPESLCARLLKAKYYPHGNLLETVFPKDTSQSWKGVEHGLDLIKRGVIWRVGNGEKIQIWRDNWIRRNGSLKITGKKKNTRIKRVKELFGNGTNGWNEDLVNSLFYPHDAEEVLKIRVGPNQVQDSVAWNAEKNGLFSVKSAYKLAINIKKETPLASSSAPDGKRNIWQRIWKAQVPNKVRIFSRRLALDNLPTQKNKWRRKLEVLNTCLICGNGTEDSFHAVVECTKARALRQRMRDFWILPKEESLRKIGKDWLVVLLDNTNKDLHQAILLTFWRAWHLRNDIIHAKGQATIEHSARFLLSYANTIKSISIIPVGQVMAEEKGKKVADNMLLCEKHQTTSTPE
jgi:hypothetical protein